MPSDTQRIEVEDLDKVKGVLPEIVSEAQGLSGTEYVRLNLRVDDGPTVVAESGALVGSSRDFDCCYNVHIIARDGSAGQGYYGGRIGANEFHHGGMRSILMHAAREAHERATTNGRLKAETRGRYGALGEALTDTRLAPIEVVQDVVSADFSDDPRKVPLDVLCERVCGISTSMMGVSKERMKKAQVQVQSNMNRELIVTSEGTVIDEAFAKTDCYVHVFALAPGQRVMEEFSDHFNGLHGLEVLDGRNLYSQPFELWAVDIAEKVARLSEAPLLEGKFENVDVVTNSRFNSLWVHEVCGHPSEADRALGMETGYAGRTWFFRNASMNQLGKPVASSLLNVCSRNDLDAFGRFRYDAEGTRGTPVYHIKNGIFVGFLHSRETAQIMTAMGIQGQTPNGSMRATNALNVPYIRMKQTGIEGGTSDLGEMISSVKHGFYLVDQKIPSMSESRENFQITPLLVYEIVDGRLGKLYRGASLMADSYPYMMSIRAVGRDVALHNVSNCGKAQPQQVMFLCNYAPSMLATGTLVGRMAA